MDSEQLVLEHLSLNRKCYNQKVKQIIKSLIIIIQSDQLVLDHLGLNRKCCNKQVKQIIKSLIIIIIQYDKKTYDRELVAEEASVFEHLHDLVDKLRQDYCTNMCMYLHASGN